MYFIILDNRNIRSSLQGNQEHLETLPLKRRRTQNIEKKSDVEHIFLSQGSSSTNSQSSQEQSQLNPLSLNSNSSESQPQNDTRTLSERFFDHIREQMSSGELSRTQKIQLLTLVPPDWSLKTIQDNLPDATWRMVKAAKEILNEKGILGTPNLRKGF